MHTEENGIYLGNDLGRLRTVYMYLKGINLRLGAGW